MSARQITNVKWVEATLLLFYVLYKHNKILEVRYFEVSPLVLNMSTHFCLFFSIFTTNNIIIIMCIVVICMIKMIKFIQQSHSRIIFL